MPKDELVKALEQRIREQRRELDRLHKAYRSLKHSRDDWRARAKRLGKRLLEEVEKQNLEVDEDA